ncbi:MarR family winged helix-turn-helix transcriptional regulator [Clostridium rectalis]|uniref:MarR family winged helix-turn-helix transcriptional regulator n=1 Tax=Clostridium rectalis TaxID=2040295 RepID=UPI000F63CC29|nr:MarR family transcriptional regulator [Clostridium rectalis]
MENINKKINIFGGIFFLANKLQNIGDLHLEGITTKQWMILVIIGSFKEYKPTISEVSKKFGSSHQNVKQLALKLEQKGFIEIKKDKSDQRVLRLGITEKNTQFWEERQDKDINFIMNLFNKVTAEELEAMNKGIEKIYKNMVKMKGELNG